MDEHQDNDELISVEPHYTREGDLPHKIEWMIELLGGEDGMSFGDVYDRAFSDVVQDMLNRLSAVIPYKANRIRPEGEALRDLLRDEQVGNPKLREIFGWDKSNLNEKQDDVLLRSRDLQKKGLFVPYLDYPATLREKRLALAFQALLDDEGNMRSRPVSDLYYKPAKPGGNLDPHFKIVTKAKRAGIFGYHPFNAHAEGWHCENKANDQACYNNDCIQDEFTVGLYCSQTQQEECSLDSDPYPG